MLGSEFASLIGAKLIGKDFSVTNLCTDTRQIQAGDFFIALSGERFDAHEFLSDAQQKGAVGALVSKLVPNLDLPCILVPDVRLAFAQYSKWWREQFDLSVVALTGSCGKTTCKEMIASILSEASPTLYTQGNFNNEIGCPLTLLKLNATHRYAVIELGANRPGDIVYTGSLTRPDVALVTMVAEAHLDGFGSLANVARTKGEIYQCIKPGGTAIINADDAFAGYWRGMASQYRQICFSMHAQSDASIKLMQLTIQPGGTIQFDVWVDGVIEPISLPILGKHNVQNALAAIAVARALNFEMDVIRRGLAKLKSVPGRLFPLRLPNALNVIDDTYNANPASMKAAIDVLADVPGQRILVIGKMAELGANSADLHVDVIDHAKKK
ncbi:MAG TPA: UDP-N-acetylmuramoyl-tripeptide--D-alanyl-D-alanine ligase, partial [Pseudomonadales bacterium]|nr:UDP-N-acetylmuramoyl-tripeptide--D-alanyl-D-alanine ligase [Pseudomonadales bacterium]